VLDGPAIGELWVSTPFQTSGYLGPRSRGGDFVPDPRAPSERIFFRTGDLVRRDAGGAVLLEGRTDLQVKVRGNRVNLQAVEQVLLEDPDVTEAAVVAFDDELAGKRLHAVVRQRRGATLSTLRLRTRCARRLTRVAIPSNIEVQDEPLPKTTTGKVDRGAVKRCAKAGTHGDDRHGHAVHR
jgi:acyl-coenzyme A synthetase/AMP-(fatty) acid ligase